MDKNKLYGIEKIGPNFYGDYQYRFYSLYNGARGAWCDNKKDAIRDGENHATIILELARISIQSLNTEVNG